MSNDGSTEDEEFTSNNCQSVSVQIQNSKTALKQVAAILNDSKFAVKNILFMTKKTWDLFLSV